MYRIRNEENKIILAHRESLSPFENPLFTENKLKVLPPDTKSSPKGAESRKAEPSYDGPARRTRSKRKEILSLLERPSGAVDGDRGRERGEEGEDDGEDPGNQDDDEDPDADERLEVVSEGVSGNQFSAISP